MPVGSLALGEVVVVVFFFALLFFGLADGVWPWLEGCWGDEEVGCGVVLDEVVVVSLVVRECEGEVEVAPEVVVDEDDELEEEVELEVEVDELEELEELEELGNEVAVVVDDDEADEVAAATHVIVSDTAPGTLTGGITPGVAITGTAVVPPPTRVTVTVHESAEAIGMAARPRTTKIAAASSSTARSLRLNVKLVRPVLPPSTCASHASKFAAHRRAEGTLLTGTEVCNLEADDSRSGHSPARARARERRGLKRRAR